tara:strand:+ start:630 stop:908 length:279 start_codon:yes stop_codon:yes gene_type:complete
MAEKINENVQEIKNSITNNKAVIGKNSVLKSLKAGNLNKIFLAKNAPSDLKEDVSYYCKIQDIPVITLTEDNEELGVICKKNFFIAVIGATA